MREPLPTDMAILHCAAIFFADSDLQAVPVNYVMIWTQGLGGFERQFQGLKRLHDMAAVSRDAKRSVYVMTLSAFSDIFA
jgi:hypothetical protein